MSNPWFRLYHEFATDPKIQMLSEVDQRRYIMVLCLRCSSGDETLRNDQVIAFQLRISIEEWLESKAVFIAKGLITKDNSPSAWDKRQYVSDSSTERVRKHRMKKKKACNVSVTPPDTDKKQMCNSEDLNLFDLFWTNYPRKQDKKKSMIAFGRLNKTKKQLAIDDCKTRYASTEKRFIPLATTYIHGERWEDESTKTNTQCGDKHNGFNDRDYAGGATPTESITWFDENIR